MKPVDPLATSSPDTGVVYERILVVDDDSEILALIVFFLEDSGFTVFQANTAEEGLEIYRRERPDLVMSDLVMPGMSGLDLLEALRQEFSDVPFLIVSGAGEIQNAIEALRLGAWDYVLKPFTPEILEHAVCRSLGQLRLINENKMHREELVRKNIELKRHLDQLEEDHKAGRNVQQQLLPQSRLQFAGYELAHAVIPSLYLSGDFIDYFQISEGQIGFYLADVSGHGASSAFVTVLIKALMERFLLNYQRGLDDEILDPAKILKHVSDDILNAKLGKYLTMVYCVLDLTTHTLTYSIGGHYPSPILWDGKHARFLEGSGFAVGITKDAHFTHQSIALPSTFTLALFSDGVFEALPGDLLAEKEATLLRIFEKTDLTLEAALAGISFQEGRHFPDDIALLMMTRK